MKTFIRSYMVLVLGAFVFSGAYGQNNSAEYDDMYYIPSEKKSAPVQKKQEPAIAEPHIEDREIEKELSPKQAAELKELIVEEKNINRDLIIQQEEEETHRYVNYRKPSPEDLMS